MSLNSFRSVEGRVRERPVLASYGVEESIALVAISLKTDYPVPHAGYHLM